MMPKGLGAIFMQQMIQIEGYLINPSHIIHIEFKRNPNIYRADKNKHSKVIIIHMAGEGQSLSFSENDYNLAILEKKLRSAFDIVDIDREE